MNSFNEGEIQSELEYLELQTLQGFWRLEKLLEEIHHDQQLIISQMKQLKLASAADDS